MSSPNTSTITSTELWLGDAPVEPQVQDYIVAATEAIDALLNGKDNSVPKKAGIVMMIFPYGDNSKGGKVIFTSNGASHNDLVVLMKEMIARFEGQPEVTGTA